MTKNRQSAVTTASLQPRSSKTRSASNPTTWANYCFPKEWPTDRERRAAVIGEWLQSEARYLA